MSEKTFNNVKITSSFDIPEAKENLVSGETIGKHFGKIAKHMGDESIHHTVDTVLSSTSTNPVQNKVVNAELEKKSNTNHTHTTINGHTIESDVPANAKFTDTVYSHPTTSGNKHIPSGGTVGQILKNTDDGTVEWSDLKIGGTNLLLNSAFIGTSNWLTAGQGTAVSTSASVLKVIPIAKAYSGVVSNITANVKSGKHILSVYAKADANTYFGINIQSFDSSGAVLDNVGKGVQLTNDWQQILFAFNINPSAVRIMVRFSNSKSESTTPFYVKQPKLEIGTEVTDWSPSPYDLSSLATTSAAGLMSASDKTKLDSIATGATKNQVLTFTTDIAVSDWGTDSNGGYSCTKIVTGLLSTDIPEVDVVLSTDRAAAMTQLAALECLCDGTVITGDDTVKLWCYNNKPTVTITVRFKVVR